MERQVKYLIIGGGAAGINAAAAIRKIDTEGEVTIIGKEEFLAYNRVLLPAYLKEEMTQPRLFLKKEEFYSANGIEFLTRREAVHLDPGAKVVNLRDNARIRFQKLLIATGGTPVKADISGADLKGVHNLYTIDETDLIIERVKRVRAGVILGGSFIAIELIHGFVKHGLRTIVLIRGEHFFRALLDPISATILENRLTENGVEIRKEETIASINGAEEVESVTTTRGNTIPCGIVGICVGIKRNVAFITTNGIAVNHGVVTDEYLETGIPDIYAAGDLAEFNDIVLGRRLMLGNFDNAVFQGTAAGRNMAGEREPFRRVSSYYISCFGLDLSSIGDACRSSGTEVIFRGDPDNKERGQIFLRDGRIVGATLIGLTRDSRALKELIRNRTDLGHAREVIADRNTPLKEFLK